MLHFTHFSVLPLVWTVAFPSCCFPLLVVNAEEVDFPPLIDSDDIAYFFEQGDIDEMHWALANIFARSERNTDSSSVRHRLPEQLVSRGGGSTYTTAYKIKHDLEQAIYLSNNLRDKNKADFFRDIVSPIYEQMLQRIPSLDDLERTQGLYPFTREDISDLRIEQIYNKALYHTDFEALKDKNGNLVPLLNPDLDVDQIQTMMASEGVAVVDNLLTREALSRIRQLLLESTVWYQTKMPKKFGGYVGAYIDDGLYDRILLQMAFELYNKLPRIMKGHFLKYLWAYKYDSEYTGINTHADQAAVNVNIWLTPDEANLDPNSGGLVVFTAKPPPDWDFKKFNTDTDEVHELILKPTNYAKVTIPHKQNRAVIFDSALFHHTDEFKFKSGYENRRINLTLLYGEMSTTSSSTAANTQQGGEL